MSAFSDRKIAIPKPVFDRNWVAESADQEDEERRILQFQKKIIELARRGVSGATATPERVAWMIFWARSFAISDAALTAFQAGLDKMAGAELMLTVIQRMSFEMFMQLGLIMQPLKSSQSQLPIKESLRTDRCWPQVAKRFRAYTAWCLWADKCLLEEMLHPKTMKERFDSGKAGKMLSDPLQRMVIEEVFGAGGEVYRAAKGGNRAEVERMEQDELRSIKALLDDRSLAEWVGKLKDAAACKPPRSLSFFELLDKDVRSMCKRLWQIDARSGYYFYMKGSMAIHGSSLDQFLFETTEKNWNPNILPVRKGWRNTMMQIATDLGAVSMGLALGKVVWVNEPEATHGT